MWNLDAFHHPHVVNMKFVFKFVFLYRASALNSNTHTINNLGIIQIYQIKLEYALLADGCIVNSKQIIGIYSASSQGQVPSVIRVTNAIQHIYYDYDSILL